MKIKPIWLDGIKFNSFKKINEDKEVDVLIIGGGITGISTAYHLINKNVTVCLVEKNKILHSVTARTTGKLTYLQDNIYTKLKDKANNYYKSQIEAIKLVVDIINKNKINCNLDKTPSYLYTDNYNEIEKIKKEENMLKKIGINYKKHDMLLNSIDCKYAISVNDTYVIHPIKYLNKLSEIIIKNKIDIYENSNVTSIDKYNNGYIVSVNNKKIKAKKVVVASHYPFFLIPYFIPIRTYIEKSYVSASAINKNKKISAITISKPIKSIRYHQDKDNYFIYLYGSHNLCMNCNDKDNFKNLLNELSNMNIKPEYIWSNQDIITEDYLPYIGYIDDNLLIGTGYNTWGMTNGSLAGKIISDLIINNESDYKDLFDPKRNKQIKDILKYPINMSYNIKSFAENKIIKNKSWYKDNVKFTKINGKNVAIYTDNNKQQHIVYNLCPHMKCSLIFNEVEKTWDCLCHGSRFDIDGKCIFGPSKKNISFKD